MFRRKIKLTFLIIKSYVIKITGKIKKKKRLKEVTVTYNLNATEIAIVSGLV